MEDAGSTATTQSQSSYRVISLLSFLYKLLEWLRIWYIWSKYDIKIDQKLHPYQYGFRRGDEIVDRRIVVKNRINIIKMRQLIAGWPKYR